MPSGPCITEDAMFGGALRFRQPAKGHRAGTDAVLLAAATPPAARCIADLGAASGIVGLRAAQLNPGAVACLFEREAELAALAGENIALNRLESRVSAHAVDVFSLGRAAEFREHFDCVLTNPPFFDRDRTRVSGDENRARAHVMEGALEAWVRGAVSILAPKGDLVMIHRADAVEAVLAAFGVRLGGVRLRFIHPAADQPAIRVLAAGRKGSRAPLQVLPPLVLHGPDGAFLPEAAALHAGKARLDMQTGGFPRPL